MEFPRTRTLPFASGGAVASFGAVLAAIHVRQLVLLSPTNRLVLEALFPLVVSLALVGADYWGGQWRLDPPERRRLRSWFGAGVVGMFLVAVWTLGHPFLQNEAGMGVLYVVANDVTVGAVFGLLLGLYDVRVRQERDRMHEARLRFRRARDQYLALFENVPDPIVYYELVDAEPVVRAVNPAFESVFGYEESTIADRRLDEFLVPKGRTAEAADLHRRVGAGETVRRDVRRRTAGGVRDFRLTAVSLDDDTGFAIMVDITEQKRRQQRLQVLNRVLRHDLRTSMNVVVGYLDLLRTGTATQTEVLPVVETHARNVLDLCDKARRIERALDEQPVGPTDVDVVRLVTDAVDAISEQYPDATVETDLPATPVTVTLLDPVLLRVVVDNLLENALEHHDGDPWVRVTVAAAADGVELRVEDDGPGIPAAELAVLDRQTETPLEHTSGLGLWLVDWAVSDLSGAVAFDTDDDGTLVTVTVPWTDEATDAST